MVDRSRFIPLCDWLKDSLTNGLGELSRTAREGETGEMEMKYGCFKTAFRRMSPITVIEKRR